MIWRSTLLPHTTHGKQIVCFSLMKFIEEYSGMILSSLNGETNLYGKFVTGIDAVLMDGIINNFLRRIVVPQMSRLALRDFEPLRKRGNN